MVKVLVVGYSTTDPDLKALRSAIVSSGGSVYYKYISVEGVYALLPAASVVGIAQRTDVESMSPNRMTVRTRSMLESITGSYEARGPGSVVSPGVDGSGVGIAFLDSGIMATHRAFLANNGSSRVKRSVDFRKLSDAQLLGPLDWQGGYDFSKQIYPGSSGQTLLENTINSAGASFPDPLGHGTIVASLAAGASFAAPLDPTAVAPAGNTASACST
jgi:subtilisin family serine protease